MPGIQVEDPHMSYSLNSLKVGFSKRLYRGLQQELLRGILGVESTAYISYIAPLKDTLVLRGDLSGFLRRPQAAQNVS